jgi:hypothetical protein
MSLLRILREAEFSADGECPECCADRGPHMRDCALAAELRKLVADFDANEIIRAHEFALREEERRNRPRDTGMDAAHDLLKTLYCSPHIKDGEAFVFSGLLKQVSK